MNAIVPIGVDALVPRDMDSAIRLAQAMASAKLVPRHLQGDTGTCLMIVEQAMRWRMSPFAVAQCTSAIGGKLMFEGKLVADVKPKEVSFQELGLYMAGSSRQAAA